MGVHSVLIQDEEGLVHRFLENKKLDIIKAKSFQSALACLEENQFDLVICQEMEVLKRAKALYPQTIVIVTLPFATIDTAVQAMRLGAFDFLVGPLDGE